MPDDLLKTDQVSSLLVCYIGNKINTIYHTALARVFSRHKCPQVTYADDSLEIFLDFDECIAIKNLDCSRDPNPPANPSPKFVHLSIYLSTHLS